VLPKLECKPYIVAETSFRKRKAGVSLNARTVHTLFSRTANEGYTRSDLRGGIRGGVVIPGA